VKLSCATCKYNGVDALGITFKDAKMTYTGCLEDTSNPSNGGILDLDTNSKQPVKKKLQKFIVGS